MEEVVFLWFSGKDVGLGDIVDLNRKTLVGKSVSRKLLVETLGGCLQKNWISVLVYCPVFIPSTKACCVLFFNIT